MEAKDQFISKKNRVSVLLTKLNKPYTEVLGVKKDSRNKLRSLLKLAIGTGITVATRQKNQPLLLSLKSYKKTLSKTNTHDLPDMASRVCNELEQYQAIAASAGLTAEKLTELKSLTTSFRTIIEGTDFEVSTRKAARKELRGLITECYGILTNEIDPFIEHCKETYPVLYNAYTTARNRKKYRRKRNLASSGTSEVIGTVTDSVTLKPIEGAIISLLQTETIVETDEDGYYEIDEITAETISVGCHAPGYIVADNVKANLKAGESLVIDFVLRPEPVAVPVNSN